MAKKKKQSFSKMQLVLLIFFVSAGDLAATLYVLVLGDYSPLTLLGF